MRQKLAVVGSGISGLGAAWVLGRAHDVDLFEADSRFGGHVHTRDLEVEGRTLAVDSGFIVFNTLNYPLFTRLLEQLAVPSRPSTMSFSVKNERTGLEYNGSSLERLFAQRRNLFSPSFHRMIRDILRFNREGRAFARAADGELSLQEFLSRGGYGASFVDNYLVPMASALWSAEPESLATFPAQSLLRFFDNHRMLDLKGRPEWHTVQGGSREYVSALLKALPGRAFANSPVDSVTRTESGVLLHFPGQPARTYDQVVLAVHSDQALRLLADPSEDERALLAAIPYQPNSALLHTDSSVLPHDPGTWGAWNARVPRQPGGRATVSYLMNRLQGLPVETPLLVSLNSEAAVAPGRILERMHYEHPVFTVPAVAARRRLDTLNGSRRTWFCGAWCGNGFHEDGLASAMAVCRGFGMEL